MSGSVETYKSQLDLQKIEFETVINSRYRPTLVAYLTCEKEAIASGVSCPDEWRALDSAEADRDRILRETFILSSKVYYMVDIYNEKSLELDREVKKLRVEAKKVGSRLKDTKGRGLAAVPHKKGMKRNMVRRYFYLSYYLAAILGGSYFIYKKTKS